MSEPSANDLKFYGVLAMSLLAVTTAASVIVTYAELVNRFPWTLVVMFPDQAVLTSISSSRTV